MGMTAYVVGDLHGQLETFTSLLQKLHLLDAELHWAGSDAQLWVLGDYTDRGPDGVGVIELLMQLEGEALAAGGRVGALLGNHDVIVLNAMRFPEGVSALQHGDRPWTFRRMWLQHAGGQVQDAQRLRGHHLDWLAARPALAKIGGTLLMHADSTFYLEYGRSLDEVNANVSALLHGQDIAALDRFEEGFAGRRAFLPQRLGEDVALENAELMLNACGAARLVHGHTPIFSVLERPAPEIDRPWTYLNGLCINVDPGLYAGGPGFALCLHDDGSPIS